MKYNDVIGVSLTCGYHGVPWRVTTTVRGPGIERTV